MNEILRFLSSLLSTSILKIPLFSFSFPTNIFNHRPPFTIYLRCSITQQSHLGVYCARLTIDHTLINLHPASAPTHSILPAPDHTAKLPKSIHCAWLMTHTGRVPTPNIAIIFIRPYTQNVSIKRA